MFKSIICRIKNWFHRRKVAREYRTLVDAQLKMERLHREDCSYIEYLSRHFPGRQNLSLEQANTERR